MTIRLKNLFVITSLTMVFSGHATIIFENSGTPSGWSYTSGDGSGTVTQVSSPTYRGSTAVKCYQTYGGSGDYTLHSECVIRDVGKNGQDRYYGYAFYLPTTWVDAPEGQVVMQLAADFSCCGGQQTELLMIKGTSLVLERNWGDPANQVNSKTTVASSVAKGSWHRVVLHKRWASDNTGIYQFWFDGNLVINESGKPNSFTGTELYRWSIGLYANFNSFTGSRYDYIDQARVTDNFQQANPALWGGSALDTAGIYQIQNEASSLVLNQQGSLTNGSKITQWSSASTSQNLQWKFIATDSGFYQINSVKSGKDAVVQGASSSAGAGIVQWSFGSAQNDQWLPVLNTDGSYTFYNRSSALVLEDPGSSTSTSTQMDQWTPNGSANQKWKLLAQ